MTRRIVEIIKYFLTRKGVAVAAALSMISLNASADVYLYLLKGPIRSMFAAYGPSEQSALDFLNNATTYGGPPNPPVAMRCNQANGRNAGWWIIARAYDASIPVTSDTQYKFVYGCGLQASLDQVIRAAREFCLTRTPGCGSTTGVWITAAYSDGRTYRAREPGSRYYSQQMGSDGCDCSYSNGNWSCGNGTLNPPVCLRAMEGWR